MGGGREWSKSDRGAFLQQCGRFAVVTPPVVTLMLSVSDKALAGNLATSGHTTKTKTTTTQECTTTTIETTTACTVTKDFITTTDTQPVSVCTLTIPTIICKVMVR